MPHAALWVVQLSPNRYPFPCLAVSMPHAALWVVQRLDFILDIGQIDGFNAARGFVGGAANKNSASLYSIDGFNAARGFVGGAAKVIDNIDELEDGFNAARGFVGGAASSLAALVPLREKSPFGKSPEI